jgi:dTDP-4-amino-4,6-dideoxygalactose transaminase
LIANIPFARPFIGKEEEEACLRVLRSGWLTTGQEALSFENEFAAFLQAPAGDKQAPIRALAVNSATSGLHLALEACGVGAGDLVIVPSYTFTATAEVVRYLGAEPVFVDVKPGTFHLDPQSFELTVKRLLSGQCAYRIRGGFGPSGKPKAVIPVHFGGLSCDMDAITDSAHRFGIPVIEDAAHSFPSLLADNRYAGTLGDIGVFSFYATKTITTGEGGMVATGNPKLADRISIMRLHGIDRNVWNRDTDAKASWYYEVVAPGYKYNMPDILAAIGRVQLSRSEALLSMRRRIAALYDAAFSSDSRFIIPPSGAGDARHLYPLRLAPSISRNAFIERLQDEGIGTSVHFIPLHTMPYYKTRYGFDDRDFPESLTAFNQAVSLPIWPGMTDEHVRQVVEGAGKAASG